MAAVREVLERAGASRGEVASFAHGMTVATNALLEERGARTALVATEGFTDVIEIARQARPELYRPCRARPAPLVPPELRFGGARARATRAASCAPLDEARSRRRSSGSREARRRVGRRQPAALLRAPRARAARRRGGRERAARTCTSLPRTRCVGVFREYERTSTTVIDAYLSPLLRGYLGRLGRRGRASRACPSRRSCGRAAA